MELKELAIKFLQMKSISEEGNEEVINFLIPIFEQMGAKLILQQVPHSLADHSKRQFNLVAILGDDLVDARTKKGLLLTSHIDTCSPGHTADWNHLGGNPFAPAEKNGLLYGLGAADAKLDFLTKVLAAESYSRRPLKQPIYLAATCGGDSALAGSKYMIQSGVVNPRQVLVGRPTNLSLVNTQKSQLSFSLKLSFVAIEKDAQEFNAKVFLSSRAQSKHVTDADANKNAINNIFFFLDNLKTSPIVHKLFSIQGSNSLFKTPDQASAGIVIASKDLDAIRDRFRALSSNHRDCLFEMRLGGTGDRGIKLLPEEIGPALQKIRTELEEINKGFENKSDPNFNPPISRAVLSAIVQERDSLELKIHYNLLPEFSSVEQKKNLEQDLKNRVANIARSFRALSIECRKIVSTPYFYTNPQGSFTQTLQADLSRSGLEPKVLGANYSSEAAYFHEKGYDTMVFGPGKSSGNSHCPNEHVSLDDLQAAMRFYGHCIEAFCVRGL